MTDEIFRDIIGYKNYQVTNLGRVFNKSTKVFLKGSTPTVKMPYIIIRLVGDNGKKKFFTTHTLICKEFKENPEDKKLVNHKDGDKTNNMADNLDWVTHSENSQHAHTIGLVNTYRRKIRKLNQDTREFIEEFDSVKDALTSVGKIRGNINVACSGVQKTAYGFCWEYSDAKKENPKEEEIKDDSPEEWKQFRDTNYQVSTHGNIKSKKCPMMKQASLSNDKRRKIISLTIKNKQKTFLVYRLVAEVFIPNPTGLSDVDHIDGNPSNNHLCNLRWLSQVDNNRHSNCIKVEQWDKDYTALIKVWTSGSDVEKVLGINAENISRCCRQTRKTAGGFGWKF
jgi:hypothetical protein